MLPAPENQNKGELINHNDLDIYVFASKPSCYATIFKF